MDCGLSGIEIVFHHFSETEENILIDMFTRDELAIVEARAVVEEKFDITYDQRLAVFVNGVLKFVTDVVQTFDDDFPLLL